MSSDAIALLEALQDIMKLLGTRGADIAARGVRCSSPHLTLGARPFRLHSGAAAGVYRGAVTMGWVLHGSDEREYDLGVDVLWNDERWSIVVQAWVESDDGGQELIRALPLRRAAHTSECVAALQVAVEDLFSLVALVPGNGEAPLQAHGANTPTG